MAGHFVEPLRYRKKGGGMGGGANCRAYMVRNSCVEFVFMEAEVQTRSDRKENWC